MKIYLVHSAITRCGFNSFGKDDESSWISHGLCSISAYAKDNGFDIKLIDLRKLRGWDDFESKIRDIKPDIIGFSMMSPDYNNVVRAVKIVKKVSASTKTVVGGPHPSIMLDEVKLIREFDYIVVGEGEISFTDLLKNIKSKNYNDRVIYGIKPDINKIPFVDRELYDYKERPIEKCFTEPFITIIAGRGCIYNCSFCQPAERVIFGKKLRRRSVNNVIEELKSLREKYNFNSMLIHDDCLTEDVKWVNEFCEEYKKNGFTQEFVCQSRADIICRNEDLVKKMRDVGLRMFIIGFESGSQRVLNFLRKGTKVENNYKASEICRKYNIKIWANYMLGIPTETKEEVMDTVNMIRKINPYHCSPSFFTPHPGSSLFDYCKSNNLILIKGHEGYRRDPRGKKIKGVDYEFLNVALNMSLGYTVKPELTSKILINKYIVKIKQILRKTKLGSAFIDFLKKLLKRG